jgi:hypothetical protein
VISTRLRLISKSRVRLSRRVWFYMQSVISTRIIILTHAQVPHCDGHNCNHFWLRFVTVKISHNAAGFRKLQKSGFSWLFLRLFVIFFYFLWLFFTFWDFLLLYCKNHHIVKVTNVTICDDFPTGYRKLQKSFFSWPFCDYLWPCLFLYFTNVLNRLTYIGCCRSNILLVK